MFERDHRFPWSVSTRGCLGAVLFSLVIGGCASPVPEPIRKPRASGPLVAEVQQAPERFVGSPVRWGGTIVATEVRVGETWIEVVSRELATEGEPKTSDLSGGRFIARFTGFLEPLIYGKGRQLTVAGIVEGSILRDIEQVAYRYPLVRVESHYLWPARVEPLCPGCDPFMYSPWYPYPYRPYW